MHNNKKTFLLHCHCVKQESLLHHLQHNLLKNSLAQLFDFVFNSISLFWEQYLTPKHCTRQLECNSPYQRCRLVEGISLSSLLWCTKVNLVTLRHFAEQSGDTTLSLTRVTSKSSRLRSIQKKLSYLTQHALLSQPTPRKKEKGCSNYNFSSSALAQIPQSFRARGMYSVHKQQLHRNCSNNFKEFVPGVSLPAVLFKNQSKH